jgi:hypothetical protein
MAEEEHDEHEAPPSTGWSDFPEEEERIIQFWRDCNAFQTSYELSVKEGRPAYVFYDGPPFATVKHALLPFIKVSKGINVIGTPSLRPYPRFNHQGKYSPPLFSLREPCP